MLWKLTMIPMLSDLDDVLNLSLVPEFGDIDEVFFDLDDIEALQPDVDAVQDRQRKNFQSGGISLEEFRDAIGRDPNVSEGMFYVPSNLKVVPFDNENYARELLELHTLGVHGGYTQNDVMEVARCLTGWTVRSKNQKPYFEIGKVEFKLQQHDGGRKVVLGTVIPAIPEGLERQERERLGRNELDRVLGIVTRHPSTARHISRKLCERFIADDPPARAVEAVASTFAQSQGRHPRDLALPF